MEADFLVAACNGLINQVIVGAHDMEPDGMVGPSGPAMPFFVVEGAEIARVQNGHSGGETKRDDAASYFVAIAFTSVVISVSSPSSRCPWNRLTSTPS
jgi:hypothetical protein